MTAPARWPRMPAMKTLHGIARRIALAVALLGLALPALPQTPAYSVEIVVFRNDGNTGALDPGAPRPVFTRDDVVPVPAASGKLGGAVAALNRNGLRVIGQASWRQEPTAWSSRRGVSAARLGIPGVTGKVIFERQRLLHLGVEETDDLPSQPDGYGDRRRYENARDEIGPQTCIEDVPHRPQTRAEASRPIVRQRALLRASLGAAALTVLHCRLPTWPALAPA